MKKVIIPTAVVVLLVLSLGAGEREAHEEHHGEHEGLEVLDRNIRLTFELVKGDGGGDEAAAVVTAIPKYELAARLDGGEEGGAMSILGIVGPRNDGRILAIMEVEIILERSGEAVELSVDCGVLLESGKGSEVARWGERALVVCAEYTD